MPVEAAKIPVTRGPHPHRSPWLGIDGISGTSAGAMNAAVLVDGFTKGGTTGARIALKNFWRRVSDAARFSPFQRGPLDILLGRWTLDSSPIYVGWISCRA